jgi:uncharacterized repeat protein (TIGR03806 family)
MSRRIVVQRLIRLFLCLVTVLVAAQIRGGQKFYRITPYGVAMPLVPATKGSIYVLKDAFPNLQFNSPIAAVTPPGETNRLFVVERAGRIIEIADLQNPTANVFMDISDHVASDWENKKVEGLTSLAFHPDYAHNGRFFVTYTTTSTTALGSGNHNRLSEFHVSRSPHLGAPQSEVPLITQFDRGDGHNFNCVAFGPDGYLYMSTGDEGDGGNGDDFHNSQKIDGNFFSGILRIDVDKRAGNLQPNAHPAINSGTYLVPADNPWVGATSFDNLPVNPQAVRTEFYAVGLRNPWRFSFDPLTQEIYEGDVGQHKREEINIIEKGGNYGWSFREGTVVGPKGEPPPDLDLRAPIVEYPTGFGPFEGYSVTGGVVYRGQRIPSLYGAYIFADYVSGNIWSVKYENGQANDWRQLLTSTNGIASFGYDPANSDVLVIGHTSGKIYRLDYIGIDDGGDIPQTLADTGIFKDTPNLTLKDGFIGYDVNTPFWSDGALKRRWFAMLRSGNIEEGPNGTWTFPDGTIWVKHFDLELKTGDPSSRKRVETRVLVKNSKGVYGVTYRWAGSTENAALVPPEGMTDTFNISENGKTRSLTWKYPSRQECLTCHTPAGGYALGFNLAQLNGDFNYGSLTTNQLWAITDAGYFSKPPTNYSLLPSYASVDDQTVSREYRVRSYLAVNCAYCHQPGGTGRSKWDGRGNVDLWHTGLINGELNDSRGNPAARVVVPGDISNSMLHQRIVEGGTYHMPPLGSASIDAQFEALLSGWIREDVPKAKTFEDWQTANFGSSTAAGAGPDADPDKDGLPNYGEYLLGTNPKDAKSHWRATLAPGATQSVLSFPSVVNRAIIVETSLDVVNGPWAPLPDPANKLAFPAAAKPTSLTVPSDADRKYFRFKVIAP